MKAPQLNIIHDRRFLMEMIRVSSDAISAIGYDAETMRMRVRFTSGSTYSFCGVPAHVHESFMRSMSEGSYYNNHIRGRYQC